MFYEVYELVSIVLVTKQSKLVSFVKVANIITKQRHYKMWNEVNHHPETENELFKNKNHLDYSK